jgi:hypothetical protein
LTSKGSVLATEIVEKRLAQLAEALGRQAVIETR